MEEERDHGASVASHECQSVSGGELRGVLHACRHGGGGGAVSSCFGLRGSTYHGACTVRVLGLFRRPFHPEPIKENGNASEPTRFHLQLFSH